MTLYSIVASQDVQSKSNFSMDKTLEYPTPYFALPFNVRFTFCNGGLEPQLLEGMKSQHGVLLTSAEVLFNEVRSNPSLLSYWMMLDSVLSISARHRCTLESNIPTPRSWLTPSMKISGPLIWVAHRSPERDVVETQTPEARCAKQIQRNASLLTVIICWLAWLPPCWETKPSTVQGVIHMWSPWESVSLQLHKHTNCCHCHCNFHEMMISWKS